MGGEKRFNATTNSVIERQPTRGADKVGMRLRQSIAFGALFFVACVTVIVVKEVNLGPFGLPLVCSSWSIVVIYSASLFGVDLLIIWLEEKRHRDLNRDGHIGRPPADRSAVVIDGRRGTRVYERKRADDKRDAWLAFLTIVDDYQRQERPTGQRALRGFALAHGYHVTDELHAEVGAALVAAGYGIRKPDGSWTLTAPLADVASALTTWEM